MPINLTNSWTGSSLVPSISRPAVQAPSSNGTGAAGQSIMQSIFGNNWQSLLNTGDSTQTPPQPPTNPFAQAYGTMADAYAQNLSSKNAAMDSTQRLFNQIMGNYGSANQMAQGYGGFGFSGAAASQYLGDTNAALTGEQMLPQFASISQAAALSPTYAPQPPPNPAPAKPLSTITPWSAQTNFGMPLSGWMSPSF